MTAIRLIATDLDGTLLRSDRTVSERTRSAIRRAQAAGVVVVIATARHPTTACAFAEAAGITGLAICSNGALIFDLGKQEVVAESNLQPEIATSIVRALRVEMPCVCFGVMRGMSFACEPGYAEINGFSDHGRRLEEVVLADGLELAAQPMSKLIVRHPERSPTDVLERLRSLGLPGFESSHSGAPFIDVVAAGVSKAAGLAGICRRLKIDPAEVMAFGDAPNDLPMLRWAGRAVAVANAFPEVLAEITEITESNDADGVAIAIERLLA